MPDEKKGWTKRKWSGLDNFKCDDCIFDCFEMVDMNRHRDEVHGPNAPKVPGQPTS